MQVELNRLELVEVPCRPQRRKTSEHFGFVVARADPFETNYKIVRNDIKQQSTTSGDLRNETREHQVLWIRESGTTSEMTENYYVFWLVVASFQRFVPTTTFVLNDIKLKQQSTTNGD
jgi:hypothetical protein